jgi:anterior pharynx defective protein 1
MSMKMITVEAKQMGHRFILMDKLYLALGWGYGHGACHVIFFFLSFLGLTTGDGTLYLKQCPQMSFFLIGALYSLGMGMILTSGMVRVNFSNI